MSIVFNSWNINVVVNSWWDSPCIRTLPAEKKAGFAGLDRRSNTRVPFVDVVEELLWTAMLLFPHPHAISTQMWWTFWTMDELFLPVLPWGKRAFHGEMRFRIRPFPRGDANRLLPILSWWAFLEAMWLLRWFFWNGLAWTSFFSFLFPTGSNESVLRSKLMAFVDAAARELRLLPKSSDFCLACRTSAFSFLMRWRRHDVDDEVDKFRWCRHSDWSCDDQRRCSDCGGDDRCRRDRAY